MHHLAGVCSIPIDRTAYLLCASTCLSTSGGWSVQALLRDNQNLCSASLSDTPLSSIALPEWTSVKPRAAGRRWPGRPGFTEVFSDRIIEDRCSYKLRWLLASRHLDCRASRFLIV